MGTLRFDDTMEPRKSQRDADVVLMLVCDSHGLVDSHCRRIVVTKMPVERRDVEDRILRYLAWQSICAVRVVVVIPFPTPAPVSPPRPARSPPPRLPRAYPNCKIEVSSSNKG